MGTRARLLPMLVALAVGCADTDSLAPPNPDNTLIGYLGAFSGTGAPGIDRRYAVQLAVEQVNAAGGVLGNPVELVIADTRATADGGRAAARDILERYDPIGFVGPARSSVTLAATRDVTIPARVPLISGSATSPEITTLADDGLVFRTAPSDALQGAVAAELVLARGIETASVLYLDDAYGRGLAASFASSFVAAGGRLFGEQAYPDLPDYSAFDFGPILREVLAGDPDALYLVSFADDGAKITRTMETLRLFDPVARRPLLVGADANRNEAFLTNAAAAVVDGMIGTIPSVDDRDPGFRAFESAYAARFGEAPSSRFAAYEYDALFLLVLAAEQAGSTDPRRVAASIEEVSRDGVAVRASELERARQLIAEGRPIDYRGASGEVDLDGSGDAVSAVYGIWEVREGAFEQVATIASGS